MKKLLALALVALLSACGDSDDTPVPIAEVCKVEAPVAMSIVTKDALPINSKSKKDARKATIEVGGVSLTAEVRGRGNSTWSFPKKPYRFQLSESQPLLGMASDKNWVLLANYSDKTMLRTATAWCVGKLTGSVSVPEARFVELTVNGDYVGLYQLTWQIDPAPNRIPADGGFLAEIDARLDGDVVIPSQYGISYVVDEDMADSARAGIAQMEAAIGDGTWRKVVDAKALSGFYLTSEFSKNNDVFWSSTYLFKSDKSKIIFGPLWDFDLSFGNVNYNDSPYTERWYARQGHVMKRFMADEKFKKQVAADWAEFSKRVPELLKWVDSTAALLEGAQTRNFQRWPILGIYVWPNNFIGNSYAEEVAYLKDWMVKRQTWMDQAFKEEAK